MKISVIIPTWNREKTIVRAINSAIEQTYSPFEILICDDGSTDNTEKLVKDINDARVRWLPGEHSGLPAVPRNRGLANCKGDWVAFLDSDDFWFKEKLEVQVSIAKRESARFISTNAKRHVDGNIKGNVIKYSKNLVSFNDLLDDNVIICSSVLMQRSLINVAGFFPENASLKAIEDLSLWLRLARIEKLFYLDSCLLTYNDDPKNTVRSDNNNVFKRFFPLCWFYLFWRAKKNPFYGVLDFLNIVLSMGRRLFRKSCNLFFNFVHKLRAEAHLVNSETVSGEITAKVSTLRADKKNPRISVIMPVKNAAFYLRDSVASILTQSFSDFELIIVDDHSTDSTKIIVDSFNDRRIRYFELSGESGIVAALNAGLSYSRGIFIARMDADDVSYPDRFQKQAEYLENNSTCVLVGTAIEITYRNKKRLVKYPTSHSEIEVMRFFENPIAHPTIMARKTLFNMSSGLYSDKYVFLEDWQLWDRLICRGKFANLEKPFLEYRVHPFSVSKRFSKKQNISKANFLREIYLKNNIPFKTTFVNPIFPLETKDLIACDDYFKKILKKFNEQKIGSNRIAEKVLEDQFLKRMRKMDNLDAYAIYFLLSKYCFPKLNIPLIILVLKFVISSKARFLRSKLY